MITFLKFILASVAANHKTSKKSDLLNSIASSVFIRKNVMRKCRRSFYDFMIHYNYKLTLTYYNLLQLISTSKNPMF